MRFDDSGNESGALVQVCVGDKTEERSVNYVDRQTGLVWPVLRADEQAHHTVDGRILISRTNGGW